MAYVVTIPRRVRKQIDGFPPYVIDSINRVIEDLKTDPRPPGVRKLRGTARSYRVRVGDYRIVYSIDDADREVTIASIDHRKDVYRPSSIRDLNTIEELQEALDRLRQQPEDIQRYVIGLVCDVLAWEDEAARERPSQEHTDSTPEE